jgi:hypothetical protein
MVNYWHRCTLTQSTFVGCAKNGNLAQYSPGYPLRICVLAAMREYFQKGFDDSAEMLKRMDRA